MSHSVTMFEKEHIKFIFCDCRNEILVIDFDEETRTAELAMYESVMSFRHKNTLKQKIRYIWRILTNKYPYNDQIIINRSQIGDLVKFLSDLIRE